MLDDALCVALGLAYHLDLAVSDYVQAEFGCSLASSGQVSFGEEHSEMHWLTANQAYALLPEGHWLRDVIQRAENLRRLLPQELRDEFRQKGLEI